MVRGVGFFGAAAVDFFDVDEVGDDLELVGGGVDVFEGVGGFVADGGHAEGAELEEMLENAGLSTIAALTGDEASTIEDYYEPYLLQLGFIEKTHNGRKVTEKAKRHLASL